MIDDGDLGDFVKLTSYDGFSNSYVVDPLTETSLVVGKIYRIKYAAVNQKGKSEYSDIVSAALADLPGQVSPPEKNVAISTQTQIALRWDPVSDTQLPGGKILNYKVMVDYESTGNF